MTAKRLTVIVNPCGGTRRGLSILDQVKPVFSQARLELDVCLTNYAGHAREIARTLSREQENSLCVIGGDGTVHEVVSGLMERGEPVSVPLGIIPGGTGNDVARQLGIATAIGAAQRIVAGRTCPLDVMRVDAEGRTDYCVTIVGWAGVGDINARAERLRRLGPPRYAFAALRQILFPKRRRARVVLDGRSCEDAFLLVAACNTIYSGSGMKLAPRAKVDDGKMDVVIVRNASRGQLLRLFAKVFSGTHVDMPCVEYHQVRSMSIFSDDRTPLDLDGEIRGGAPVSIEVIAGAVSIFA